VGEHTQAFLTSLSFIHNILSAFSASLSCLHESCSCAEALYNLRSGSWLAWANDTAAHYAAIHCTC